VSFQERRKLTNCDPVIHTAESVVMNNEVNFTTN